MSFGVLVGEGEGGCVGLVVGEIVCIGVEVGDAVRDIVGFGVFVPPPLLISSTNHKVTASVTTSNIWINNKPILYLLPIIRIIVS